MEILTAASCNTATLTPYVPSGPNPWTFSKVQHVYRRLGFSASQSKIDEGLSMTPGNLIDSIVDTAFNLPATPAPFWGFYAVSDFSNFEVENEQYILDWRILTGNNFITQELRGRLTEFWLNHFVTELETYFYSPYLFQYYHVCETYALGNFKDFVHAIGINHAMLLYLNGFENTNVEPNENYAREFYELFTLGEGNGYSETDIVETSKAFTGYNHMTEPGGTIYFDSSTFVNGDKTIFGQTGNWGYDDVINILFQEKESLIAVYICRKLYQYFVSPDIDATIETNIITPLSQTFINSNFELVPVLKQLFKSEHFFDERATGVVIKSPFDLIFNFVNESEFAYNDELMEAFIYFAGTLGQNIYNPPNVAGWQRDEDWISTSTLTGRWQLFEAYLGALFGNGQEEAFRQLAKVLSNDSIDPAYITKVIVDYFNSKELYTASDYDIATDIFKWEVPQNYYDEGLWNLDWESAPYQVYLLLVHLATIPEFQLK
ncbi:MAG: DUF1800 domain-containing protein [Flavobacteriaceae bacterium]|nr:DUF1800 domain-containing protein [Flavobacteriaceae bacterium]